ncbi:TonB-dependent receptor [Silvibacterium dinghuense]|uniref:TonB-dependent receptor n=1 Tax=Silvibacterium dinghuense TaxID=1560006 RepID=UPI001E4BEA45|nr:TonB-dependent receptor [Silvibacterium dinghuense]
MTDRSKAVIRNARVVISPGNTVAITNGLGNFTMIGLAAGSYTLTVTSPGFNPQAQVVALGVGQAQTLDVVLQVGSATEQVIVTEASGPTQTMTQAINEEITSANIVNVIPESEIVALPNANIADAVGRMPGVTLQRDEGEGVYVQVRGLDPRLTNVTIDGVTIPAPEVAIRQVDLATIPDDMVQSIELNKTLSANQDADGIGGSVNLVTKTAGTKPYFGIETTMGYTPIQSTRYMGKVDTTAGMRFGAAQRWGLIGGAEYDYNGRGINDIEPNPILNPDGSDTPDFNKITLREYRYDRLRWGGTSSLDYKLSDHSIIAAHFMLSDFKDWGDKWYYEIETNKAPSFYESLRRPDLAVGTFSLNGNHIFKNSWVHWGSAISRSRELNSGGNPEADFAPTSNALNNINFPAGGDGNVTGQASCTFDPNAQADIHRPRWSENCMVGSSPMYNLNNYGMTQFITTTGQAVELNLQEQAGMGINYHLGSLSSTFEFGGEFRNSHAFQYAWTPTYDTPTDANGNPTVLASLFQTGFTDPNYYDGSYHNGPFTDYYRMQAYVAQNQGQFPLDQTLTHFGSDSNNFDLIERVSAGYMMNTIDWPKFRLQAGLRLEATQVHSLGFTVNPTAGPNGDGLDDNGNWIGTSPTSTSKSYIDPLPSVQARWQVAQLTAIRAVYARGISRPNPYDLVPYLLDNGAGSVPRYAIGNPNEQPTHANNFDLLLEQELRPFGVIQTGYFYKQLIDPIVSVYLPYTTVNPDGSPDLAAQNINADNASIYGLEFSWQQRLNSLPGILSGLGMMLNYAYTGSHTHGIPGRTDAPPLIGQARHAFNIEPSYEYGRFEIHTGISYNGANDNAYQYFNNQADPSNNSAGLPNGPNGDNYFFPHLQVDAQVGARIWHGLQAHIDGLNLTNEVFGFYNGSPQYMTQREYYKPTYSLSLRWHSGAER